MEWKLRLQASSKYLNLLCTLVTAAYVKEEFIIAMNQGWIVHIISKSACSIYLWIRQYPISMERLDLYRGDQTFILWYPSEGCVAHTDLASLPYFNRKVIHK